MKLFLDTEGWLVEGESAFLAWLEDEYRLEAGGGELHLILVDNRTIEEMNRTYLGHEGPTDVISFNLVESGEDPEVEGVVFVEPDTDPESDNDESKSSDFTFPTGEVYVSLEMAALQAREYGVSLTDEVSRLALHGALHVAGWLDDSDEQRVEMARREDEGLARARLRGDGSALPWRMSGPDEMEG